jgi:hypothetical protein
VIRGKAGLYLGLSTLYREQGDVKVAAQNMLRSENIGEQEALDDWAYRLRIARVWFEEDQDDLGVAANEDQNKGLYSSFFISRGNFYQQVLYY